MSSSHRSHMNSTGRSTGMSPEEAQRVRYMAHMERRARPPTFRPLTIVVVVLSLGLFVIGLVMIVIAHWPGVSGGDSMKIAGGILLAVGGLIFIITMIVTCVLRNRERDRFEKSIASLQASRSNISVISRRTPINTSGTPTPSVNAQPGKSILKKTPSTSTYGTNRGSVFGEEDSGVNNTYNNSFGQHSYEQGSTNSDNSAGKYEVYRIETLPDPSQARRGKNGSLPQSSPMAGSGILGSGAITSAGILQTSTDSEGQGIPTPVRNTKKRRAQSPSVASSGQGRHNPSYSQDPDELNVSQDRQHAPSSSNRAMHNYSNEGYDMYEGKPAVQTKYQAPTQQSTNQQAPSRQKAHESFDSDTTGGASVIPQAVRKKKKDPESTEKRRQRRAQQQQLDTSGASYGAGAGAGISAYPGFQNQAFTPQEADLGYQQTTTTTTTRQVTRPPRGVNTSAASADDLHINIKAQPGTAVHITPSGAHVQRPKRTAANASQSSVETEI